MAGALYKNLTGNKEKLFVTERVSMRTSIILYICAFLSYPLAAYIVVPFLSEGVGSSNDAAGRGMYTWMAYMLGWAVITFLFRCL